MNIYKLEKIASMVAVSWIVFPTMLIVTLYVFGIIFDLKISDVFLYFYGITFVVNPAAMAILYIAGKRFNSIFPLEHVYRRIDPSKNADNERLFFVYFGSLLGWLHGMIFSILIIIDFCTLKLGRFLSIRGWFDESYDLIEILLEISDTLHFLTGNYYNLTAMALWFFYSFSYIFAITVISLIVAMRITRFDTDGIHNHEI